MQNPNMPNPNMQWKKRILLPFWIIRMFAVLLLVIIFGMGIGFLDNSNFDTTLRVSIVVYFIFLMAVLLLDVAQIYLFVKNKLNPKIFVIINAMQFGFFTANFLMQIYYVARYKDDENGLGLGIMGAMAALYLSLLIYAGIGYYRQRKNMRLGNYALTYNHDLPAYQGSGTTPQHTAYHPQYYSPQPVKPANMV